MAPGWASHPSRAKNAEYSIPEASKGRGVNRAFRDTWMDQYARTYEYIPGPGAWRTDTEFEPPAASRAQRRGLSRPQSAPSVGLAAAKQRRGAFASKGADSLAGPGARCPPPEKGADTVDARRIYLSRPATPKIASTQRIANLKDFREVHPSKMPSSFYTPGPGAYTAYSVDFGMPVTVRCTPRRARSQGGA